MNGIKKIVYELNPCYIYKCERRQQQQRKHVFNNISTIWHILPWAISQLLHTAHTHTFHIILLFYYCITNIIIVIAIQCASVRVHARVLASIYKMRIVIVVVGGGGGRKTENSKWFSSWGKYLALPPIIYIYITFFISWHSTLKHKIKHVLCSTLLYCIHIKYGVCVCVCSTLKMAFVWSFYHFSDPFSFIHSFSKWDSGSRAGAARKVFFSIS